MVRALTHRWDNLKFNPSDISDTKIVTYFILATNPALFSQDRNNTFLFHHFAPEKLIKQGKNYSKIKQLKTPLSKCVLSRPISKLKTHNFPYRSHLHCGHTNSIPIFPSTKSIVTSQPLQTDMPAVSLFWKYQCRSSTNSFNISVFARPPAVNQDTLPCSSTKSYSYSQLSNSCANCASITTLHAPFGATSNKIAPISL